MSHDQKKTRIIERAVTFTGLKQNAASELARVAHQLSIRQLRRIIGAIQRDFSKGLRMLDGLVPKGAISKKVPTYGSRQTKPAAA
jgi:hypothetical protein